MAIDVDDLVEKRTPVTLLTGFLGSGKTTLLNNLVQQADMADTLIIINEFGEISIDHLLVNHSSENIIVEMSNGCVCCTVRGDLIQTLKDVRTSMSKNGKLLFKRVIIETTGLADPMPILHTIIRHADIERYYWLDGVVTTIDTASGNNTLDHHSESVRQAAIADCLILTKNDLAPPNEKKSLIKRLQTINPTARIIHAANGDVSAAALLDFGMRDPSQRTADIDKWINQTSFQFTPVTQRSVFGPNSSLRRPPASRHDDSINAFCFSIDNPVPVRLFELWLELVMMLVSPKMLRIKGIFNIKESEYPFVIHGVQHIFHAPIELDYWPTDDRRSKVVFITQDLDREIIEGTLMKLLLDIKPDDSKCTNF